jgi:hypothetical protein
MPRTTRAILLTLFLSAPAFCQGPAFNAVNADRPDAFQVRYYANLSAGDGALNLTNAGVMGGLDPGGDICANVYVFAQDQQLAACCACPLTPNHLRTLSVQKDLISNLLTPGVPTAITVAIATTLETGGLCDGASVQASQLVPGLRAWGTTLHALPGGAYGITETEFSPVLLGASELTKLTQYCGFIEAIGSGYGICNSCRDGAAGAEKQ